MKKRLDLILFEKNLFETKEKAKQAVCSGIVFADNKLITKPGNKFEEDVNIKICGEKLKYVSRAGLKLEYAKNHFNINFDEKIIVDAGASTGGFTDVCLQNGAKMVYAVDVGTNQLHNSLLRNNKVVCLEKTDIRNVRKDSFVENIDIVVTDLSFISLTAVLGKFYELLNLGGGLICLIKPQFECGKIYAKKCRGVVKDEKVWDECIKKVIEFATSIGFKVIDVCDSPILGGSGNKEFLAYMIK